MGPRVAQRGTSCSGHWFGFGVSSHFLFLKVSGLLGNYPFPIGSGSVGLEWGFWPSPSWGMGSDAGWNLNCKQ